MVYYANQDSFFHLMDIEPTAAQAAMSAIFWGLIGVSGGAIAGHSKVTIPINGNHKTYNSNKEKLMQYKIQY